MVSSASQVSVCSDVLGNTVSNRNANEDGLCSNARFPLFNLATSTSGSLCALES